MAARTVDKLLMTMMAAARLQLLLDQSEHTPRLLAATGKHQGMLMTLADNPLRPRHIKT